MCANRPTAALSWQSGQLAPICPLFTTSEGAESWHVMNRSALALNKRHNTHSHTLSHSLWFNIKQRKMTGVSVKVVWRRCIDSGCFGSEE